MSGSRILNCPPPPEDCPWLVYTRISNKRSIKRNLRRSTQRNGKRFTQTFYSLSEDHCYKRSITDINGKNIFPCSQGWLLMLDMDYESDDCFLLNPVSMEKIQLPPWTGMSMHVCNLTRPQSDPNCMVVAFSGGHETYLRFCRPGDKKWTVQKLVHPDEEYCYGGFPVACEGKLYCFPRLLDELMVPPLPLILGLLVLKSRTNVIDIELDVSASPLLDACRQSGLLILTAGKGNKSLDEDIL